jgi:ABC-type nitrate/sulfonate/bicarbonate transport system substrate-binding protein
MKQPRLATVTILMIIIALVGAGLGLAHDLRTNKTAATISLALDWTPNTNHTGVYVALSKGWYRTEGLNVKLLPYSASVSADTLVATGKADVGISSTEGIVADAGTGQPVISIAAIIAHNTSELAVRKDSGITSPAQLDGKIYGGFGAPYESAEVGAVIKDAGGTGDFKNVTLDVDPIQALQSRRVDVVWIFAGWEVIEAQRAGLALTTFPISQYGVPDYPTPNFITSPATAKAKPALIRRFMAATARGYQYARVHPQTAAHILLDTAPAGTFPDSGLVTASQVYLSPRYQDARKAWGVQSGGAWSGYVEFMLQHQGVLNAAGQPVKNLDAGSLYTNEFLP